MTRLLDIQLGKLKAISLKLCEVTFVIARICNTTTQPYMGCGEWSAGNWFINTGRPFTLN